MTVKTFTQCQNCGSPIKSKYGYCQRSPACQRLYKREQFRHLDRSEYHRSWYAANRERILAQQKEYHAANPEKLREQWKRWRAANPDYLRQYRTRPGRRCKRKGCEEEAALRISYCKPHDNENSRRRHRLTQDRTAQLLYDRQNGVCPDANHGGCGQPLGSPGTCHIDHLIPLALGGCDEDWNLQLMHAYCNRVKQHRVVPAATALLAADQ